MMLSRERIADILYAIAKAQQDVDMANAAMATSVSSKDYQIAEDVYDFCMSRYKQCVNQAIEELAEINIPKNELDSLKKDAQLLAEYVCDENTSRVYDHSPDADALKDAAVRILEATKGHPL